MHDKSFCMHHGTPSLHTDQPQGSSAIFQSVAGVAQIFESPHMKHAFKSDLGSVIRRLHKDVIHKLQALAQGLLRHQAPSPSDWAAQREELLAAAAAASQVRPENGPEESHCHKIGP